MLAKAAYRASSTSGASLLEPTLDAMRVGNAAMTVHLDRGDDSSVVPLLRRRSRPELFEQGSDRPRGL
jgi:hypothetical protein